MIAALLLVHISCIDFLLCITEVTTARRSKSMLLLSKKGLQQGD